MVIFLVSDSQLSHARQLFERAVERVRGEMVLWAEKKPRQVPHPAQAAVSGWAFRTRRASTNLVLVYLCRFMFVIPATGDVH